MTIRIDRTTDDTGAETWRAAKHISGSSRPAAEYAATIIAESALLATHLQETARSKGVQLAAQPAVHVEVASTISRAGSLKLTATATVKR